MDANRLETPRLSLTLLSMGDVKACVDIDSDPVVTRYTGGPANRWTRPQWLETWIKAGRPPRYGLWLVREIATRHGGSVRCEPREGGGARFVVRLPRREPRGAV